MVETLVHAVSDHRLLLNNCDSIIIILFWSGRFFYFYYTILMCAASPMILQCHIYYQFNAIFCAISYKYKVRLKRSLIIGRGGIKKETVVKMSPRCHRRLGVSKHLRVDKILKLKHNYLLVTISLENKLQLVSQCNGAMCKN